MFCSKLTAGVLAGAMATAAIGAPLGLSAAAKLGAKAGVAEGPLARLIQGNIGRLLVLRSELNVTDQQREEIRQVFQAHKPEIAEQAKGVWQKRSALRDAVMTESSDEEAIRRAADELGKAIGDAAVVAAKIRGEIAPVLTDEQKEQIQKCRQECDEAAQRFFTKVTPSE